MYVSINITGHKYDVGLVAQLRISSLLTQEHCHCFSHTEAIQIQLFVLSFFGHHSLSSLLTIGKAMSSADPTQKHTTRAAVARSARLSNTYIHTEL